MENTALTKESVEQVIAEKLLDIWETYKQYNPEGEYLSLAILVHSDKNDMYVLFNNSYYEDDTPDAKRGINYGKHITLEEES